MQQAVETLHIQTRTRGLTDITHAVRGFLRSNPVQTGLLTLWCRHTSASLLVQENADRDVRADLEAFFARIAPEGSGLYTHDAEGPDDMPAHIRAALTQTQLSVPITESAMVLGTWQASTSMSTVPSRTVARWCCICWASDASPVKHKDFKG